MKKQRYIVEIKMPDGDFISAGWLKDLIQTDCDVEDESRKKVTVQETSLPSDLDEAELKYVEFSDYPPANQEEELMVYNTFKAGAEWMAGQGVTVEGEVMKDINNNLCVTAKGFSGKDAKFGDKVVVQIRKK